MIWAMYPALRLISVGLLALVLPAAADVLRPETGVFAGPEAPTPYELRLRRELLGGGFSRMCQMLSIPSREPERAVYMLRTDDGSFVVLSRRFKASLWMAMQKKMAAGPGKGRSYAIGPEQQAAALRRVRAAVHTQAAILDPEAGNFVAEGCKQALLRVAPSAEASPGPDGTTHHASHWDAGTILSGKTWSPEEGSLAADFVAMEEGLRAFAESELAQRAAAKAELLARVRHLRERLGETASHPIGKTQD